MNNNTITATVTDTTLDLNAPTLNEAMVKTATDRLAKTSGADDLDSLVASTGRRSLLLVDCSGSMDDQINWQSGERKIDALRKIVADLRESHPVPVAAFGCHGGIRLIDAVPEPQGGTPMGKAIRFAHEQGANHIAIVTDGCPDSQEDTLNAAREFGNAVDVFFVGSSEDEFGQEFSQRLAKVSGGKCTITTLDKKKELTTSLRGLLGDGSGI